MCVLFVFIDLLSWFALLTFFAVVVAVVVVVEEEY